MIKLEAFKKAMESAGLTPTSEDEMWFLTASRPAQLEAFMEFARMSQPVVCQCKCECDKCDP